MILVAGAGGSVGAALVAALESHPGPNGRPRALRAFVRREYDALRLRDRGIEAVIGDAVSGRGMDTAMRGVRTLVYLVQTFNGDDDLVASNLAAVQNTLIAARAAGVQRVITVGHIAASDEAASQHLVARWATELAVRQSGLGWVVLRAPFIVGRGSTLFESMRRVVARSPVVPLWRWRQTEVEPVALSDVVEALRIAIDTPEYSERSFDIAGSTRTTFGAVVRGWGRTTGAHRLYVPLPGWGERAGEQIAWSLARLPRRETRLLLETLRERQVCVDPSRRFPLGRRPLDLEAALAEVATARRSSHA
ncbi:MAG: NAD(P)H-binding protein [Chloroflexi bacterium]|nr:NAD(P)H-binding protein [Chloroflexota bacterium]MDA1240583.1 NAD(P)H-binding protein [Chloroflexota bacterium]